MTSRPTRQMSASRDERTAVDKAVSLLLSFGQDGYDGLGVSELARRADLSKSTAFRLLGMLDRNGVVERIGSGYRLGSRLHELGQQVYAPEHDRIRELTTPFLIELYELTRQTAHLAVLHGGDVLLLGKLYGPHTVPPPSRMGGRAPAHCTATGKILLAYGGDMLHADRPLVRRTPRTIGDPVVLRRHLAAVREQGIAFDDGESRPGLRCVAAAIFASPGHPLAALSVCAPASRFDPRAHPAAVRKVAHEASRFLATQLRPRRSGLLSARTANIGDGRTRPEAAPTSAPDPRPRDVRSPRIIPPRAG
jgi:IclR family transcriptional regulator, KDG regulon repressor